jgi:hypothetical protein
VCEQYTLCSSSLCCFSTPLSPHSLTPSAYVSPSVSARHIFYIFAQLGKISKSDDQLLHVCLFVRMEQLGSRLTDFNEIWYLKTTLKSV